MLHLIKGREETLSDPCMRLLQDGLWRQPAEKAVHFLSIEDNGDTKLAK